MAKTLIPTFNGGNISRNELFKVWLEKGRDFSEHTHKKLLVPSYGFLADRRKAMYSARWVFEFGPASVFCPVFGAADATASAALAESWLGGNAGWVCPWAGGGSSCTVILGAFGPIVCVAGPGVAGGAAC